VYLTLLHQLNSAILEMALFSIKCEALLKSKIPTSSTEPHSWQQWQDLQHALHFYDIINYGNADAPLEITKVKYIHYK